jgi:hypothetical protein
VAQVVPAEGGLVGQRLLLGALEVSPGEGRVMERAALGVGEHRGVGRGGLGGCMLFGMFWMAASGANKK